MTIEHFQNLIIGSGVAGKLLAWALASQGQKTVVVERSMVGGSCPNVDCLPSKNVIYSARAVSLVHPTTGLGVVTGPMRVDMAGVARRKRQMVAELVEVHLGKFRASGAELVMGEARFTEPKTVRVALNAGGTRSLRGERVFLNVGTRTSIPDVPGLAAAGPMTHVEALNLERLPEHTAMRGGLPYTVLRDTIWTHPTAAEGLLGLFANPPSAPRPMQPVASGSAKGPRELGAVPAS